jgi:hypothetical protein
MVFLEIAWCFECLATGTPAECLAGLHWREVVAELRIPEGEARAHIQDLVAASLLWDSPDGCLGLPEYLCLTPAHAVAMIRGWRFVPMVVHGGRR